MFVQDATITITQGDSPTRTMSTENQMTNGPEFADSFA
jgi:hypothetical protein